MLLSEIIYFILPLLLAGLLHHLIIIRYDLFSFMAKAIDNGINLGKQHIFGKSKTWRGIIVVVLFSGVFYFLLSYFFDIDFEYPIFVVGMVIGAGYALGELPNSFFKRRLNIGASNSSYQGFSRIFYFIDQTDSVLGALIFLYFVYDPSTSLAISILFFGSLLHWLADRILHKYSYKKNRR